MSNGSGDVPAAAGGAPPATGGEADDDPFAPDGLAEVPADPAADVATGPLLPELEVEEEGEADPGAPDIADDTTAPAGFASAPDVAFSLPQATASSAHANPAIRTLLHRANMRGLYRNSL